MHCIRRALAHVSAAVAACLDGCTTAPADIAVLRTAARALSGWGFSRTEMDVRLSRAQPRMPAAGAGIVSANGAAGLARARRAVRLIYTDPCRPQDRQHAQTDQRQRHRKGSTP
jgi:predicted naringenin-chalcone synthase